MTETQRKFLTEYLGECWHSQETYYDCDKAEIVQRRTFTELKDKQDLLEAVIEKFEWNSVTYDSPVLSGKFIGFREFATKYYEIDFTLWLIQLSPEATAELICKWKGVE